jgi:hypothetical protein
MILPLAKTDQALRYPGWQSTIAVYLQTSTWSSNLRYTAFARSEVVVSLSRRGEFLVYYFWIFHERTATISPGFEAF